MVMTRETDVSARIDFKVLSLSTAIAISSCERLNAGVIELAPWRLHIEPLMTIFIRSGADSGPSTSHRKAQLRILPLPYWVQTAVRRVYMRSRISAEPG
jgi:hypothetical protein